MATVEFIPTQPPPASRSQTPQSLSNLECLILAQAVYQHGANAWHTVSTALSKHPSLARPKLYFTPESCHVIYARLMSEASLECSEVCDAVHAPQHLKLAQRHYSARLLELRDLIAAEEVKFKRIVAEIHEIRRGAWDDRIETKLSGQDNFANDVNHDSSTAVEIEEQSLIRGCDPVSLAYPSSPAGQPPEEAGHNEEELAPGDVGESTILLSEMGEAEIPPTKASAETLSAEDSGVKRPERIAEEISPPDDASREDDMTPTEVISQSMTQLANIVEESVQNVAEEESMVEPVGVDEGHNAAKLDVDGVAISKEREPFVDVGIAAPREGKRKAPDAEGPDDRPREKKRPREESLPADSDEQVSPSTRHRGTTSSEPVTQQQIAPSVPNKRFQTVIGMLHSQISQHRNGNIFHNPIKNSEAPDYHEIIKRAMDLKTIKARIKDGIISNSLEFQRDVYLMFANAMMYNRPGSDIYQMAEEMMTESEVHIHTFRQTEGFVRSTRS